MENIFFDQESPWPSLANAANIELRRFYNAKAHDLATVRLMLTPSFEDHWCAVFDYGLSGYWSITCLCWQQSYDKRRVEEFFQDNINALRHRYGKVIWSPTLESRRGQIETDVMEPFLRMLQSQQFPLFSEVLTGKMLDGTGYRLSCLSQWLQLQLDWDGDMFSPYLPLQNGIHQLLEIAKIMPIAMNWQQK
jgi:hypothetical protein